MMKINKNIRQTVYSVSAYVRWFELCIISVSRVMNQLPISFVLGFYIGLIYGRFWKSFLAIPSPNKMAIYLANYLHGSDEESIMLRRTAVRYICASFVLAMRTVNFPVRKRFPTMEHVGESGLLTAAEMDMYYSIDRKCKYLVSIIPLTWCASLIRKAYDNGKIKSRTALIDLIKLIDDFRTNTQTVFNYDSVNVPLCYTQAVTFGVYSYFAAALIGYQYIPPNRVALLQEKGFKVPNMFGVGAFVPVILIVQFIIYVGLVKVAEALLNPHGENDDDFEICGMVDKNLNNGYMIVTEMHNDLPELQEDKHWNEPEVNLPYTDAAAKLEKARSTYSARLGSIFNMQVNKGAEYAFTISHLTNRFLRQNNGTRNEENEHAETVAVASLDTTNNNAAAEKRYSNQLYLNVERALR